MILCLFKWRWTCTVQWSLIFSKCKLLLHCIPLPSLKKPTEPLALKTKQDRSHPQYLKITASSILVFYPVFYNRKKQTQTNYFCPYHKTTNAKRLFAATKLLFLNSSNNSVWQKRTMYITLNEILWINLQKSLHLRFQEKYLLSKL